MIKPASLAQWGAGTDPSGILTLDGVPAVSLAERFGTPLHVVQYERLRSGAAAFANEFRSRYDAPVEVYFAAKTNALCGTLQAVRSAGLGVEVFTPYELRLAQLAGFAGSEIVVNGPAKSTAFLAQCLDAEVRFIVADSVPEVQRLAAMASGRDRKLPVLLRANVAYVPRGMSPGTSTGSAKSVFGMIPDELSEAVRICQASLLEFHGLHMHIGSSIRFAADYANACRRLCRIALKLRDDLKATIDYLDIGGGFGVPMVREYSSLEFVLYHAVGRAPREPEPAELPPWGVFAEAVVSSITEAFSNAKAPLPVLALEPGRCLTSQYQTLLLRVREIKRRKGRRDYVITDGGQMTVNFPTFYEHHSILCCREPFRKAAAPVDLIGGGCYSADFVRRNAVLPPLREGDLLAIMDAGAYFLSFEGNFSFPRAAVAGVAHGESFLLRRAETVDDMLSRELTVSVPRREVFK